MVLMIGKRGHLIDPTGVYNDESNLGVEGDEVSFTTTGHVESKQTPLTPARYFLQWRWSSDNVREQSDLDQLGSHVAAYEYFASRVHSLSLDFDMENRLSVYPSQDGQVEMIVTRRVLTQSNLSQRICNCFPVYVSTLKS